LKESSKKLTRLFKENKNLNEDVLKVRQERDQLEDLLKELERALANNQFDEFQQEILEMLEDHNKLEQLQVREKQLMVETKTVLLEMQSE
jgi:hypothetical protein